MDLARMLAMEGSAYTPPTALFNPDQQEWFQMIPERGALPWACSSEIIPLFLCICNVASLSRRRDELAYILRLGGTAPCVRLLFPEQHLSVELLGRRPVGYSGGIKKTFDRAKYLVKFSVYYHLGVVFVGDSCLRWALW
jgi:hypothetical protein